MPVSTLEIIHLGRPVGRHENDTFSNRGNSWGFVVDGVSLRSMWPDRDVAGVLGWGSADGQGEAVAKLRGDAPPDYPPDRVAIFVCPECGDLGCGSVTVAVRHEHGTVTWSDFRWEVNWYAEQPEEATVPYELGPFVFDARDYNEVLNRASSEQPQAG